MLEYEYSLLSNNSELSAMISALSTKAAQAAQSAAEAVATALADPASLDGMDPDFAGETVGSAEEAIMAAEELLSAAELAMSLPTEAEAEADGVASEASARLGDTQEVWFEFITDTASGGGGVRPVHLADLNKRRGSELVFKPGDETWTTVREVKARRANSNPAAVESAAEKPHAVTHAPQPHANQSHRPQSIPEKVKAAEDLSRGLSGKINAKLKRQETLGRQKSDEHLKDDGDGGGMTISRPFNVSKWKASFGQPLENCETCVIHGFAVPRVLETLSQALRTRKGLREEGIFRLAPDAAECDRAKQQLNMDPTAISETVDVHVLANLIKVFFRSLPAKLLSSISQEEIARCTTGAECMQVLQGFPLARKGLMLWLLELMADVSEEQSVNKMNERAIAIVIAPNLYEPDQNANPMEGVVYTQKMTKFLSELLFHYISVRKTVRRRASAVVPPDGSKRSEADGRASDPVDSAFARSGLSMNAHNAEKMAAMLRSESALANVAEEADLSPIAERSRGRAATSPPEAPELARKSERFHSGQQWMGADL